VAEKRDVINCLKNARDEVVSVAEGANEAGWSSGTYEDGWTARDVLAHLASTSGAANFILTLARAGGGASGPASFDGEAFNREQVAMRKDRSVDQLLDEIRANIERDIQAVESADEGLMQAHYAAPWGAEGTVAEVIINSVNGHLGGHIADLRGTLH
jgi:uncharacterized protein (TIGR03083 family)